jgi:hypothetical protein
MHLQQLCEQRDGFVAERHLDEACRSGERYKLFTLNLSDFVAV